MDNQRIIKKVADFVKSKQLGETSGHDWWHTYRVWELAKKIAQAEGADLYVVELSALLHDLDDWKFSTNDDSSAEPAKVMLEFGVEKEAIDHVCDIIKHLSFKGAGVDSAMITIEGKVVQDADRLDALGAIGVARAFTTGATRGRIIYDPESKISEKSEDFTIKDSKSSIHHFYDKLFLLKDLMNTETAKEMARERHEYMAEFVKRFLKEWEGK